MGVRNSERSLRLRGETKSAVARPWDRKFLGYSFWLAKGGRPRHIHVKVVAPAFAELVTQTYFTDGPLSIGVPPALRVTKMPDAARLLRARFPIVLARI